MEIFCQTMAANYPTDYLAYDKKAQISLIHLPAYSAFVPASIVFRSESRYQI